MRRNIIPTIAMMFLLVVQVGPRIAAAQGPDGRAPQPELPRLSFGGPVVDELEQAKFDETDRPLPINLATALRLADARPLVIEAARAAVQTEFGLYQQARVLWLPTANIGVDYQRQNGAQQNAIDGTLIQGTRSQFLAGGGAQMVFALTDAIYAPLAERQLLRARNIDIQTAKNDALLAVAVAFFDVQQSRGILAGTLDAVARARELERRVNNLGKGLAARIEIERVRATREDLEQQTASARQDWLVSSAALTRVLRLHPGAVVVPLEPPQLQVTLVSLQATVDALIPVGLTNRPELESQQAVVQAALVRMRQERMRPLIPSLVLQSNASPTGYLGAGTFASGTSNLSSWGGRSDWDAEIVWQFKNLGLGNRGLVTQRRGEQRQSLVELYNIQDQVAQEVTQTHAQVNAAAVRMARAEAGLKAAILSYNGNLIGLSQTVRAGELLVLVNRPQEVVAALMQLQQAYINYYTSTNDYNRAQFRLFRALGYPAQGLACDGSLGNTMPVDSSRPAQMAPVTAPEPCIGCPR